MEKTKDYSIFKIHESNRDLNEGNVAKLEKSIATRNLLEFRPILVDEKMRIIDGRHRYEAAKRLGVEVFYIIMKKAPTDTILLLNTNQKKWILTDYMKYHCSNNNENYIRLNNFMIENSIGPRVISSLFRIGRSKNEQQAFKEGKLILDDEALERARNILDQTTTAIDYIRKYSIRRTIYLDSIKFKSALIIFLSRKGIEFDVFMQKLELRLEMIRPCVNQEAYTDIFIAIYNFRNRNPIEGKYLEEQDEEIDGHGAQEE